MKSKSSFGKSKQKSKLTQHISNDLPLLFFANRFEQRISRIPIVAEATLQYLSQQDVDQEIKGSHSFYLRESEVYSIIVQSLEINTITKYHVTTKLAEGNLERYSAKKTIMIITNNTP